MTADPPLASCLYVGTVQHARLAPFLHEFQYRMFMVCLDLDELRRVFRGRWLWSTHRPNLAWFRRADHLGDPDESLADSVRRLVWERLGRAPEGPIRLLTHLRYFGFVMNPVSFYYCFDAAGRRPEALVAEVHNTPWGEQHCYVFDVRSTTDSADGGPSSAPGVFPLENRKEFHVSPFMPMDMDYRWRVSAPGERLSVGIENRRGDEPVFQASLDLERRPITGRTLAGVLARYPWMTMRVFAAIYWQALKLWVRGAVYHPHPRKAAAAVPAGSDGGTLDSGSAPVRTTAG